MKKTFVILLTICAFSAVVFVTPFNVNAATKSSATQTSNEGTCVSPSIVEELMQCPTGIELGKGIREGSKAKAVERKEKEKKKKEKLGPGLGRDYTKQILESSFRKKRESKKIDILKKEINLLKRLIKQTANDNPEKAEILKRLADGYHEFYQQLNYMARSLDEKIFTAKKAKKKKNAAKMKAQQKKLDEMARAKREESIKAYVAIRNGFPDYPDYDEILFAIAYEIDQLASEVPDKNKKAKYRERARVFYKELIRNHPRSRFIPHSWMSFGEYYFHEARDVDLAMKSYENVVEWGEDNNPNFVIAMYYQAWCLFNMQEYKKTINQFNKVIQYADNNPNHREAQAVAKRSRIELVDAFSKIGNPSQAWDFFKRVGGDLAHKMLVKLSDLYYGDGHWADAVIVLHKLEALEIQNYLNNNGDDLCYYQVMVTEAILSSKPKDEKLVEIKRLLGVYKKFVEQGKHAPDKVKKCEQRSIAIAWDTATHWHVEAVGSQSAPGTKDANTMELTIQLYDFLLDNVPTLDTMKIEGFDEKTKPTNYRMAYYKAELYWNMEDWGRCGPAFDDVVSMNPKGEYTSDSAYAAVLCYNKVYVQTRGKEDKSRKHQLASDVTRGKKKCDKKCKKCRRTTCSNKKGKKKNACFKECLGGDDKIFHPREFTSLEKGILKSYQRYVCFVTKGEDIVNIKYRRARIFYEANQFEQASVLFKDIALTHSDHELGIFAANLYLDCLNVLGSMIEKPKPECYDDLASIVDIFIDTSKLPGKNFMKDEEFASQIKALKVGVLRKKAESLNKRKRFKEAAEIYLVIYKQYKGVYDDRGMCEVLFNAAINMEADRLVMPAIKVREKMIELYPDCEHSKKAAYYIGQNYHALQYFPLAASNYEDFAKRYPGEEESPEAMSNAITFYIGLGQFDKAWSAISKYEKLYGRKKAKDAATVFFSGGYIYLNDAKKTGSSEDWGKVRSHYIKYIKRYKKVKSVDEIVQAQALVGDSYWNQPKRDYAKAIKSYKNAFATFDKGAMEKVTENTRKAKMLIAAAKARYYIAEMKFREFKKIKFPEFRSEKALSKKIEKWNKKDKTEEDLKKEEKWKKDRRRLARWGYWDESKPRKEQIADVKKEEKKEISEIQFKYWLEHQFKPWMESKSKILQEATDEFVAVAEMHVPEWEMAAAARAGDMQYDYMNSLYDAPIPPSLKGDQELIDIYRGAMDEKAQPFRDGAVGGYQRCLIVSTRIHWFNNNSLRCEKALNKLDPGRYPIAEEIRIQPKNELSRVAQPQAILNLESLKKKKELELSKSAEALTGSKSN